MPDRVEPGGGEIPVAGFFREFLAFLRNRPSFLAGYAIVIGTAFVGLVAPLLPLHSPVDADAAAYLLPPSLSHPMGTDTAGPRHLFARAARAACRPCDCPGLDRLGDLGRRIGGRPGRPMATVAAASRARRPCSSLRSADVIQAFPVFALALVLVAVLGQGVASIVHGDRHRQHSDLSQADARRDARPSATRAYVEAARIAGAGDVYLLTRHVIPNAAAPLMAQMTINMGVAVLLAAGLSFLGAGVRAPTPEWGSMIAMGFQNIVTGQWWPSIFPGLALALTVFGLGRIGASIQAWSSPRDRLRPSRRAWRAFVADRPGRLA